MGTLELGHSLVRSLFFLRRSFTCPLHTAHFTHPMLRSIAFSLVRFRARRTGGWTNGFPLYSTVGWLNLTSRYLRLIHAEVLCPNDAKMLPTKFQVTRTLQNWDRHPPPFICCHPSFSTMSSFYVTMPVPTNRLILRVQSVFQQFLALYAFVKQDKITRKSFIELILRKVGWK